MSTERSTRLFDFMHDQLKNKPLKDALVTKINGKWEAVSSQEFLICLPKYPGPY